MGCDQLLCNDVNCTDVFTTGVDASGAALTATGTLAGATLSPTRGRVRQLAEHHGGGQRGPAELCHRNHGQHSHHQQHGQRRELHHGGRRVHGHTDGLGRSNRGKLRSHRAAHGRHADHHRGGLHGPAGLRKPVPSRPQAAECRRAAWSAARFLGRSLPDEELCGLEQAASVQQQRGPRQRPGAAAAGQSERAGLLERDGGAHQCELIMINDEALVQTKSLSTQLSLTTNQRNPGCLVIAGNTGNVVCNTSFTDLSDSRVKTEIADRFGLQRAAPQDGAWRPGRRGEAAGHRVQGSPRQRRQVPAQQGLDEPPHQGSGGRALSEHRRTRRGALTLSTATCSSRGPWTPWTSGAPRAGRPC